jgi:hypothetical protein
VFKEIFSPLYDVVLNTYFSICLTARSGSRYCFGLRGKGGSESKTRRSKFLSSQVGNPSTKYDSWVPRPS